MQPFPKKDPDFLNERAYVEQTATSKELIQKELSVNQVEQNLLTKRLLLMKQLLNDLPSSDPQYSTLLTQLQMDEIELGELRTREILLIEKIEKE